ncbi:MAG: NACHT domain-containing protein [Nodosilinea sp.]
MLDQVLDLGKPVLESYVRDFFRDCLDSGVARAKASSLKQPMAEAIGFFIQRFIKELQYNGVPRTSFDHYYNATIKKFVRDKTVRSILGKAFDRDNPQIDHAQLRKIWEEKYENLNWRLSAGVIDWRRIAWDYQEAVKGIIKADSELRGILNSNLLEDIAHNTAQLSPGFDTETYRTSLQSSYGYLKLYTLDSTDRADTIKLWNIFIEQTVREALPPSRYDLPLDIKRQLQAEGRLDDDLSAEALEYYRRDYFQQPARKVLEAVADSPRAVILGDPGSGKSSLLQYLALEWVEGNTDTLPLLIELREFALAESANFLDFLHRGRGVDWQFDQQQLHQHLLDSPTLVMFDGLDEIFNCAIQSTVIDDIIRFAQQYPQARLLVTTRIIGYNHERLQHSGFQHFTMQSLDTDEIYEFVDRWYDLSMGGDPDRERLKQRLKDAIANSKAIQNLADNPLLLTMMAILNRRQELPRDRADLYDQASRVLLYHWDVDHKRLQLPMDAIGRREKQEMLRVIAYEMQAGEDGLKGNLISADRLTQILMNYLRDQGFSEPREKANRLIQQLRERNFILCYRGADTYGFMHRTFLEYFCALEIVHRFEKQRTLTFEQLRDKVFGEYYWDQNSHEVLKLVCGLIPDNYSLNLIRFLSNLDSGPYDYEHIFLAAKCLGDIKNYSQKEALSGNIKESLEDILMAPRAIFDACQELDEEDFIRIRLSLKALSLIAKAWKDDSSTLRLLESIAECNLFRSSVRETSLYLMAKYHSKHEHVFQVIKQSFIEDSGYNVRKAAAEALVKFYAHENEVLSLLKYQIVSESHPSVRSFLIENSSHLYQKDMDFLDLLIEVSIQDKLQVRRRETSPRKAALSSMIKYFHKDPKILASLSNAACNDPDEELRQWSKKRLKRLKLENDL